MTFNPHYKDFNPTYKIKDHYPDLTASATIYVDGLMCLCFDGTEECTVGIHNQTTNHHLKFGMWEWDGSTCGKIDIPEPGIEGAKEIWINVNRPVSGQEGVYVYDPAAGSKVVADRNSYCKYCLDMEGPLFDDAAVVKKSETLWPRFYINNGLFCSYKLSQSTFALTRGNGQTNIGSLALALAADIFVDEGGSIDFVADKSPTPFLTLGPWKAGDYYEIAITNTCFGCDYEPNSPERSKRNDFYLYYQTVDVPADQQFDLVATLVSGDNSPVKLGKCVESGLHPASDPAPCQWLGFGRTPKLNP